MLRMLGWRRFSINQGKAQAPASSVEELIQFYLSNPGQVRHLLVFMRNEGEGEGGGSAACRFAGLHAWALRAVLARAAWWW